MTTNRKLLFLGSLVGAALLIIIRRKQLKSRKNSRKEWTRKWIERRSEGRGILNMIDKELLEEDPSAYQNFLRLKNTSFEKLLLKVAPLIEKKNTTFRSSVSPRNR